MDIGTKSEYRTITGRRFDLTALKPRDRRFLSEVLEKYRSRPGWSEFASWWNERVDDADAGTGAIRICQDLEARLGIAEGKVAPPDYRDHLADLIEEQYGSRYRFCQETGFDQGHLSRVLASKSDLSIESLQEVLKRLHAVLVVEPEDAFQSRTTLEEATHALGAVERG